MSSKNITLVANANGAVSTTSIETGGHAPVRVKAQAGVKYLLVDQDGLAAPENVTVNRVGADLYVTMEGDTAASLVLEDYFALSGTPAGLYGIAEDEQLYAYAPTDGIGSVQLLADGSEMPVALGGEPLGPGAPYLAGNDSGNQAGAALLPLLLFGAGAGALAGLAIATSRHDHHDNDAPPMKQAEPVPSMQVFDDVGPKQGIVQPGESTDDARPTLVGSGWPGYTITIRDGDTVLGTTTVDGDGHWRFTPASALPDGEHFFTATQQGPGALESAPTWPILIIVDTVPPVGTEAHIAGAMNDAGLVNTDKPVVIGTGEPGDTITVRYPDGQQVTTTVDGDGNWSAPPPDQPLADGSGHIVVTETDPAGNENHVEIPVAVDTHAPDAPHIGPVIDDVEPVVGELTSGQTTNDSQPTFNGTAEPGSTIDIRDNGAPLGRVSVSDDGTWTFEPDRPLADGEHRIDATATDEAGNASDASRFVVRVDTTAPDQPTVGDGGGLSAVIDDVGPITGPIPPHGVTDDPRPEFIGNGAPGDTIAVYDGGEKLGDAPVRDDGTWSFTPRDDMREGSHSITITETDLAGNESAPSEAFEFTSDYTPPDASNLAITGVYDDVGVVTGNVERGGETDDSRPAISGTGTADDLIVVSVKDATGWHEVGRAMVGEDGAWSLEPATPLVSGENEFTAIEQDEAGNRTDPSAPYTIMLNLGRPQPPVIGGVLDDVGLYTGLLQKGDVTDDSRPTVSGTAQAGSTVKLYDGSALIGSVMTDAAGNWTITPDTALSDGAHDLTATATNAVGQVSDATGVWNFVVDTTAPSGVTGLVVYDDVGAQQGPLANGDTTDDNRPTLSGQAEPGSTVSVYDNDIKLGDAIADESGNWQYTPQVPLTEGSHALATQVTDVAGNSSAMDAPFTITVDTSGMAVQITSLYDDVGSIQGEIAPGSSTDDTRPTIEGAAKAGSLITLYDGTATLGTTQADSMGQWSYTPTSDLGEGEHSITATAQDPAGNVSEPTAAFTFTIDTTAPTAPTIVSATDDVGAIQGALTNGGVTDDPSPTLTGTAEPGSTVSTYDNGKLLGTVTADASGNWNYTPTTPLNEGLHEFTATATDAAGNTGPNSAPFTVTTDYTPPDASQLAITGVYDDVGVVTGNVERGGETDDGRPVISGTGTADDLIVVSVKDATGWHEVGRAMVDANGAWSLEPATPLVSGENEFTAIEQDEAGNRTDPSAPYTIMLDSERPQPPVIGGVLDDVGLYTGLLQKGDVTDDSRPTVSGTAQAGSTVKLYDGSALIGSAMTDAAGNWTITPDTALSDGAHDLTATATNAVGQVSDATGVWNFVVDTTAPSGVTGLVVYDDVGAQQGPLANGDTTDDNRPTLSGQGEPGSTVSVYDNDIKLGDAIADESGNWQYTPQVPLTEGSHALATQVTDVAGNQSGMSQPLTVVVDTSSVAVRITSLYDDVGSIQGDIAPGSSTDDTRPAIEGAAKAGSLITLYDGTATLGTTQADSMGQWSYTPTSELSQGEHSITATAQDPAGNVSAPTAAFTFTIDTTAPTAPAIVSVTDDVGAIQGALTNGGVTDDPSPTLTGTAEPGSTVSTYDNGKLLGTVTADASGNWNYTPTTPLNEGLHEFTATATDAAGNTGPNSAPFTVTTDYTPPDASQLAITGVYDDVGVVTGNVERGGETDDSRPVISGTGTADDLIVVSVKDATGWHEVGRAMVDANGAWSLEPATPLVSGENEFTAIEQDEAGNRTDPSAPYTIMLDSDRPQPPVIGGVLDDVGLYTGLLQKGDVTDDSRPTVSGTAQAGSTVKLYDGSALIGSVMTDAAGNWTITPDTALSDGAHDLTATATNAVGQVSDATGVWNFVVDTTAPSGVTGLVVYDDVGAQQGPLANGDTTDDNRPTLSGQAEPGSTVSVYDNDIKLGDAIADESGNWQYTPQVPLTEGSHALATQVTDVAGNQSGMSQPLTVVVDTSSVAVQITSLYDDVGSIQGDIAPGSSTDDTRPTIEGAAKAGSLITLYDGTATLGTTQADSMGQWSYTPTSELSQGEHSITATAQDPAGNVSAPTAAFTFTIDTTAPTAPAIVSVTDDVGAIQGALTNGGVTDDPSPTLTGTAEPGSTVSTYDNGKLLGTVTADASGNWNYTPTTPLNEGLHEFTATATDAAGNTGPGSTPFTVTTDYTPPQASITIDAIEDDNGPSSSDFITNDDTLQFRGTLDTPLANDEHVQVSVDGGSTWHDAQSSGSAWTYDNTSNALPDGAYDVEARVVDTAGNVGHSAQQSVVVDTVGPWQTVSIDGYVDDVGAQTGTFGTGTTTDDRSPLLRGSLSEALVAGEAVYVYDGSTLVGAAAVDSTGSAWTLQLDGLQAGASHTFTARVADLAGNLGAASNAFTFDVRLQVTVDPETTPDMTPIVTGAGFKLEAGESMQVTVNGVTYNSRDGAVVVDPSSDSWYLQIPDRNALPAGTYDVSAVVLDSQGLVMARDTTSNELVIAPTVTPTVSFGAVGSALNKGTAITLGSNGQWEIFSNQTVFNGNGTNAATLANYTATPLQPSTTKTSGLNDSQSVTFVDLDRNGTMDIVGEDSKYADGQQAWLFDGSHYQAVQIGLTDTSAGNAASGTTNNAAANTWVRYGGVIAADLNGDGLPDIAYGDANPNDSGAPGGSNSQFVDNTNGTLNGFVKDSSYTYSNGNAQPQKEVSGVDINNDGTVDIVYHASGGSNKAGSQSSGDGNRLVVATSDGNGALHSTQVINCVFDSLGDTTAQAVSMTWADFNGDGYMDLFLGTPYGCGSNSTIYFNDGNGHLMSTNVTGVGMASGTYTMGDKLTGGPSLAIDWNGDGRMDIVEAPRLGSTGTLNLYTNNTSGNVTKFATTMLQAGGAFGSAAGVTLGGSVSSGKSVTGMVSVDLDWDGAKDLLVFTAGGTTTYVHNPNAVAEGTSLHLRIVDQNGVNAFYGNTVELVDSHGVAVASQVLNPQSGNQTNDSTGIVDFYGLNPNETYSAVLLRNVGGVSSDVGGVASASSGTHGAGATNAIENVNAAWSQLAPGDANHAYVLTAASGTGSVNAYADNAGGGADLVGTGYNDTFVAQAGTAVYDGAGGTTTVSGLTQWSNTGGMDIVDYKLAGATPLTIDLSQTTSQYTGYNTATFRNIEGLAGGQSNDRFTDSGAGNQFEGRGGNDVFDLVHGGHDTLLYKLQNPADATGGNGTDTVDHFTVGTWEGNANADRLDLSDLLTGYTRTPGAHYIDGVATIDPSDNIADFLQVTSSGADTVVSIDRDGTGGAFTSTALVVLTGVQTDLATLLANHQIV